MTRHRSADESGTVSLELVLLVPVLVLLTLFVLWAGRGGRAGLTADLAAEEAVTAAALCCGEDSEDQATSNERADQREEMARQVLESRPGLDFLCVHGIEPRNSRAGSEALVNAEWLEFGQDAFTGGIGVLDVRFGCETDGAVAPMAGLLPTVTFEGQAVEVVTRQPKLAGVRFEDTEVTGNEGEDMVFVVVIPEVLPDPVEVDYRIVPVPPVSHSKRLERSVSVGTTATRSVDFDIKDPPGYDGTQPEGGLGTVTIPAGTQSFRLEISVHNDCHGNTPKVDYDDCRGDQGRSVYEYDDEGNSERVVLQLLGARQWPSGEAAVPLDLHPEDDLAVGSIIEADPAEDPVEDDPVEDSVEDDPVEDPVEDDDDRDSTPRPYVWLECPSDAVREKEGNTLEFTVRLRDEDGQRDVPIADSVAVVVSVAGGTAEQDKDYELPADPQVVLPAAVAEGTYVVTIKDDYIGEETETLELTVVEDPRNPWPAYVNDMPKRGRTCPARVQDDEAKVAVAEASAEEGGDLAFTVTLSRRTPDSALPDTDVVVDYELQLDRVRVPATIGDTCAAPGDASGPDAIRWPDLNNVGSFTSEGSVTFNNPSTAAPSELMQTITVLTCDDRLTEPPEYLWLALSATDQEAVVEDPGARGEILDNDTVRLVVDDPTATETDGTITFNVSLRSGAQTPSLPVGVGTAVNPVVVKYTTEDSPGPVSAGDPDAASGGDVSSPVDNDCATDGVDYVALAATELTFHGPILDDPNTPEDEARDAVTEHLVRVPVCDDNYEEEDEVFELVFTQPGATPRPDLFDGDPSSTDPSELVATGTIVNVGADTLTVDDPTAAEGQPLTFTVTLHNARENASIDVNYAVTQRTAIQDADWEQLTDPLNGTLTLTEANPTASVTIRTLSDKIAENPEEVALVLTLPPGTPPNGPAIAKGVGTGTITDVSPAVLNVSSVSAVEDGKLAFVISLVDNDGQPYTDRDGELRILGDVPVTWSTPAGRGFGTAVGSTECPASGNAGNADYIRRSGSYTFTKGGDPTVTVEVTTCRDTGDEGNETLSLVVELSETNPYAARGDYIGTGTIIDLPPPVLRIFDAEAPEGERLNFKVELGRWKNPRRDPEDWVPTPTSETVEFTIGVASGGTATPGTDFTVPPDDPLSVTLPPGATSYTSYSVQTLLDEVNDPLETVFVNISDALNANLDDASATGEIIPECIPVVEGETPPTMTLHDTRFTEDESPKVPIEYSAPLCAHYQLEIKREAGTAGCGTSPSDAPAGDLRCLNQNSGGLDKSNTAPGAHEVAGHPLGNPVYDDKFDEHDETVKFSVRWGPDMPPSWHALDWVTTYGVIVDDDPEPIIRIQEASAKEGDDLVFELTLNTASGRDIAFEYRTSAVSATPGSDSSAGGDYGNAAEHSADADAWTRVEIAEGNQTASIAVKTFIDARTDEGDETLRVELRTVEDGYVTIGDGLALGTIREGDGPLLRIANARADEGTSMRFVVTLDPAVSGQVTVDYETAERSQGPHDAATAGEADTEGADYKAASGTLTFAPNETSKNIDIEVHSDDESETDETFFVVLSNAQGASLADPSGVGTINGELTCVSHDDIGSPGEPKSNRLFFVPGTFSESDGRVEIVLRLEHLTCESLTVGMSALPNQHSPSGAAPENAATPGVDFTTRGPGPFDPLTDELRHPIVIIDDAIDEVDEALLFNARASCDQRKPGCPAHLNDDRDAPYQHQAGTIEDNDSAGVSVDPIARAVEGRQLSFVVRLGSAVDRPVTVDYATVPIAADGDLPDGTERAADGVDYRTRTGTLTIPAGETSATIRVNSIEDVLYELTEVFELRISDPSIGDLDTDCTDGRCNVATGRIADDDPKPVVRITNQSADEGETLAFVVTLDTPAGTAASVAVATRDGTDGVGYDGAKAKAGDVDCDDADVDCDYTPIPAGPPVPRLVFAPGEVTKTVSVAALADTRVEKPERFFVDLSDARSADCGKCIGTGTIRDISERQVSIDDASVNEGGTLAFTLSFPGSARGKDITIGYTTVADSATARDDYDARFEAGSGTAGTVRILAGQTSATIRIPTVDDRLDEPAERLLVKLADADGATLLDDEAAGTIIDNDPLPTLSVADIEAVENGDGTPAKFTVTLSEASGRPVTVPYSTVEGTAKAAAVAGESGTPDYVAAPAGASVTIPAGQTTATVDIALIDDDAEERVEAFQLHLGPTGRPVVNATLDDGIAVARIIDDDGNPLVLMDDPDPVLEADGATVTFTVRLSRPAAAAASVNWATEAATAKAGVDFTAGTGTLNFAVGDESATVTITLVDDDTAEETETFRLKLSGASNLTIGDDTATATILDDDDLPAVSIADARVTEDATASFEVSLSRASPQAVTVPWSAVADPTAADRAAVAGQDFTAARGTLTIPARAAGATVSVATLGDALDEHVERFWVRLGTPTGATLGDGTASGFIDDDDPLPAVSISGASEEEGEKLTFTVRLSAISGRAVRVPWATVALGSAAGHATPGDDYVSASGTLEFPTGTTTLTVEVESVEDTIDEPDETFGVQLGEPDFAAAGAAATTGVIADDDSLPRLSVTDIEVLENDSPAIFTVTLSRASSEPISVDYATRDGTAKDKSVTGVPGTPDYGAGRGTLTIAAGLRSGEISVYVVDDSTDEPTETFDLVLSNPTNVELAEGADEATASILDDEQARISIAGATAREDAGTVSLAVTLSHPVSEAVTVRYATFDGSATQPDDYIAASGTLSFAARQTRATLTLTLTDDTFVEDDENFVVRLSSAAGATLAVDEAIVTILDDDELPVITPERSYRFLEDDGEVSLRIPLSHASDRQVTVGYRILWPEPSDCDPLVAESSGVLVFPAGALAADIDVTLIDDSEQCALAGTGEWRKFYLEVSNPVGAQLDLWAIYDGVYRSSAGDDDKFEHESGEYTWSGFYRYNERGERKERKRIFSHVFARDTDRLPCIGVEAPLGLLESEGPARFRLYLSHPSTDRVTVDWATGPVPNDAWGRPTWGEHFTKEATAGTDYTVPSSTQAVFEPGATEAWAEVPLIDDEVAEPDNEGFGIRMTRATGTSGDTERNYGGCPGAWTTVPPAAWIIDDDSPPVVTVADVTVDEKAGSARFEVSLSRRSASDVTVPYSTADGTATQPHDYTASSGTLTITAGDTQGAISVPIIDDGVTEADETFTLNIASPTGAQGTPSATATIKGDAGLPTLSVADVAEIENDTYICTDVTLRGTVERTVTVQIDEVAVPSLGVRAATPRLANSQGETRADWAKTAGTDRNKLTFTSAGSLEYCVYLVGGDDVPEHDERLLLVLSDATNAAIAKGEAWMTILDNDLPQASVSQASAAEGASAVTFTIELHEPGIHPASVGYTTAVRSSAGDAAAVPGQDYTEVSGTVEFAVGVTSVEVSVPITPDGTDEPDESFLFVLSPPISLLTLANAVAVGFIEDDDPGWWVDDLTVTEASGGATAQVKVHRDHTGTAPFTLQYEVSTTAGSATGGTTCDTAGVDYVIPPGSVVVPAAATQATISITICDDDVAEGRETLLLELTNVDGRDLAAIVKIADKP